MKKRFLGPALLLTMAASAANSHASSMAKVKPANLVSTVTVTFRLNLETRPASGTTFWVSYGPVDGRFGILRLTKLSDTRLSGALSVPTGERANFFYIAGHGTMRVPHLGVAPGNPVYTIREIGPVTVERRASFSADWRAPVG